MTDTDRLNECINNSGFKRGYISEQLGISRFTLSKKIKNETEFLASEIERLRSLLKLSNTQVYEIFFYTDSD